MELRILDLGHVGFRELEGLHKNLAMQRLNGSIPDTLIVANHPPTITMGSSRNRNVLHAQDNDIRGYGIEVVKSERAGGASYLGPGQISFYPVFNLGNLGVWPYEFLRQMEGITHNVAQELGAETYLGTVPNPRTGKAYHSVWHNLNGKNHKFFAIGLHTVGGMQGVIDNGGFSICLDERGHKYFHLIDHCGFKLDEVGVTSLKEMTGKNLEYGDVRDKIINQIGKLYGYYIGEVKNVC